MQAHDRSICKDVQESSCDWSSMVFVYKHTPCVLHPMIHWCGCCRQHSQHAGVRVRACRHITSTKPICPCSIACLSMLTAKCVKSWQCVAAPTRPAFANMHCKTRVLPCAPIREMSDSAQLRSVVAMAALSSAAIAPAMFHVSRGAESARPPQSSCLQNCS